MGKVLFIPLNTNHVLIFKSILNALQCDYEMLCHDNISEAEQYHTEALLRKMDIRYRHFTIKLNRSMSDNIFLKIMNFVKIKKGVQEIIKQSNPLLTVLAIDNDPIAQLFIKESRKQGITTLLVQEGMIRPYEYKSRKKYASDYLFRLLRSVGIILSYIKYGTGGCDRIMISGNRALGILKKRGVPENRMIVIGQPKYDDFIRNVHNYKSVHNEKKIYLYATSTGVIKDKAHILFLKKLIESSHEAGIHLIIKLHPRLPYEPADIYKVVNLKVKPDFEIIKEGDDTFEILKRSDVLITVSSNVVLEALMLNKECITVDYLAGEFRLDYGEYDAVHCIENEDQINYAVKNSLLFKKNNANKQKLLEDELYKLDGKSGIRTAHYMSEIISDSTRCN